jgi:signal transduction histidine kinase
LNFLKTIVLFTCLFIGKIASAQDFALKDSLLRLYDGYAQVSLGEKSQDTLYFIILNDLAFEYIFINPDSAIYYAELGESITKGTKYFRYEANSLMYKGMALEVQGEFYEAIDYLEKTEAIFLENKDSLSLARTLINKAYVLSSVNNYNRALKNLLKAKEIVQLINHQPTYYQLTTNLGTLYSNINDLQKAERSLQEANQKYEEINLKEGIIITSLALGSLYKKKSDSDKTVYYLRRAIDIARETGNKYYLADALHQLALHFNEIGNTTDAIPLVKESLVISLETQSFKDELKFRCLLANTYIKTGKIKLAEEQLAVVKAKAEGKSMHDINALMYEALTEIAKKEGRYQDALSLAKMYKLHHDSLMNDKMNDELHFLSLEYINLENKKMQAQLHIKELEVANQITINKLLTKKNAYLLSAVFLLCLIIALGFLFYFSLQKIRKKLKKVNRQFINERNLFIEGPVIAFELNPNNNLALDYISENVKSLNINDASENTNSISYLSDLVHNKDEFKEKFEAFIENKKNNFHVDFLYLNKQEIRKAKAYFNVSYKSSGELNSVIGFLIDVHKKMNLLEELEKVKSLLNQTNRIGNVGGWRQDFKSGKLFWSDVLYELHGLEVGTEINEEVILTYFKDSDSRERLISHSKELQLNGKKFDDEFQFVNKSNELKYVRIIGEPIYENDELQAVEGIFMDITKQKKQELELEKTLNLTEDQNNRLENFTQIVSHNLKSHSDNYQLALNQLNIEKEHEKIQQLLIALEENTFRFQDSLEHLNEIVKIQNNTNLTLHPIRLKEGIQKVINHDINDELKQEVNLNFNFDEEATIMYVPAYFDSVIFNLISNALKYKHPQRKAEINIDFSENNDFWILEISDNGQGIDLEKYGAKLFGMYKTFHNHKEAKGLGLFLTKNQIESLGGKIEVNSQTEVGTTFTVFFKKAELIVNPNMKIQ